MIRVLLSAAVLAACVTAAAAQEPVQPGDGAVLRGLDKVNGEATDLELLNGQDAVLGSLAIELDECRYPEGNPAGDAYAFVTIRDVADPEPPIFRGWMVASSPALNALDHPRYDVWVLRCKTS